MILDSGICTIFEMVDVSRPGGMPDLQPRKMASAWYGWLDYATSEAWPTDKREEVEVAARIRINQNRAVNNRHVVVLARVDEMQEDAQRYEVTRAFHGNDDENGQPITDLTLRSVTV